MPPLRFRYQTLEIGKFDIHVRTLRDKQQFSDDEGLAEDLGISSANWPMFGVLWEAAHALATLMADYPTAKLRILEVGCGIGLASLVLHCRHADITATDHHPETAAFLRVNVDLNGGGDLPFVRAPWGPLATDLGVFDLIIGSDLLYEDAHPALLANFIDAHAAEHAKVILVGPSRGLGGRFTRQMGARGYEHAKEPAPGSVEGISIQRYARVAAGPPAITPPAS